MTIKTKSNYFDMVGERSYTEDINGDDVKFTVYTVKTDDCIYEVVCCPKYNSYTLHDITNNIMFALDSIEIISKLNIQ